MTTCPARVPVSVELCPDASSATANKVLAISRAVRLAEQFVGLLQRLDFLLPEERRAARTRMATLTKNAPFSASSESKKLYLHASRLPASVCGKARVCTSAECR